jgi:hypothetical protein
MTSITTSLPMASRSPALVVGKPFVSTAFDTLFVGGGLSLFVMALVSMAGGPNATASAAWLPIVVLLCASTHVGASTVRLYTKPGAVQQHRFLTLVFPLVAVVVLTVGIAWPEAVGRHIQILYMTWNPYHYAAQAYGLALMYCYRSGCQLDVTDKKLLRIACLVPFVMAFISARGSGLEWLVAASTLDQPNPAHVRYLLVQVLSVLTFAVPCALFVRLMRLGKPGMPLISVLTVVTNGVWWVNLNYGTAFVWATLFHGVQYLAISAIFYAKEQGQRPDNRRGALYHSVRFYLLSAGLAYCLFNAWPVAYALVGFGWAEAMFLTTAVLSLHHVVVDAYIWRLRRDPNYRLVTAGAPA